LAALLAALAGLMVGIALGWTARQRIAAASVGGTERAARQLALEQETARLAAALTDKDHSLNELTHTAEAAASISQENRRLLRRVRDLETALKSVNSRSDEPSAALEMQLVMALKERDVAQKALLDLQGRQAVLRNAADPDGREPDFPDLPELDDTTDESGPPPHGAGAAPDTSIPPEPAPSSNHEPEPDEQTARPTPRRPARPLTDLPGIDADTAGRLQDLGVHDLAALAGLDDTGLAALEDALGSTRPSRDAWRDRARQLLESSREE
jgi:predicted flap endonuclease-1-like 5' DNA nuclease